MPRKWPSLSNYECLSGFRLIWAIIDEISSLTHFQLSIDFLHLGMTECLNLKNGEKAWIWKMQAKYIIANTSMYLLLLVLTLTFTLMQCNITFYLNFIQASNFHFHLVNDWNLKEICSAVEHQCFVGPFFGIGWKVFWVNPNGLNVTEPLITFLERKKNYWRLCSRYAPVEWWMPIR